MSPMRATTIINEIIISIATIDLDIPKNLQEYGTVLNFLKESSKDGKIGLDTLALAVDGLRQKEQISILVKQKLTEEELKQVVAVLTLNEAEQKSLLTQVTSTKAKLAKASATRVSTQADIADKLVTVGLSTERAKNTAIEIASIQAKAYKTGASKALVQTEIEELLLTKGLTIEQAKNTAATVVQTTATNALTTGIKAQAAAWLMTPMGIITAVAAGTFLIVKAVDMLTVSYKEQVEKVKELEDSYKSLQSEIGSVNIDLKSTQDRMLELSSMGTLTFVEAEELTKLKSVSEELEIQLALLEKQEEITNKKLAQASLDLYNKKFGKSPVSSNSINEYRSYTTDGIFGIDTEVNNFSAQIVALEKFKELKEQAFDPHDIEFYNDSITYTEQLLIDGQKELQDIYTNLSALKTPTNEQKDALDEIGNSLKYINAILIPEQLIDNVLSKDQFAGVREEIEKLASEGKLSTDTIINSYSALNTELESVGISASDLAYYFNNLSAIKLDTIVNKIASLYPELENTEERIKEIISELSDDAINILINVDDKNLLDVFKGKTLDQVAESLSKIFSPDNEKFLQNVRFIKMSYH